jgi:superfamily II DNA or RNA helicase
MAGNPIDDREICELDTAAVLPRVPSVLSPGAIVTARARRWALDATLAHADCCELHLRGLAGEGRRVLLWPFDRPAGGARALLQCRVVPLRRWAAQAGAALASSIDPLAPRASFTGEVLPYQLAPALAITAGAARIVLADEVGLGKTVQAGWILADLLVREREARVLVAVPAGLREQWASELAAFFSLVPERVDAAWLRSAVADRAAAVSPWAAPGAYLGSIDFLKRPDVARSVAAVTWDLLVVDEAHTATAPTERHAALAAIGGTARRVVIITATPYSGDPAGFASMTALGAAPGDAPPLMFRRSRDEVGDRRQRRHRFATLRIGRAEFRLQRLLERYSRDVWRDAPGDVEGARLAMTVLRKRALSSPSAALRSLDRRLELLRAAVPAPRQLSLFDDPEPDAALPDAALATPGLPDAGLEERWLIALAEAAARAAGADSKERWLTRLLARVRGEATIVFTEYRDTLRQLATALPGALQLHGGMTGAERAAVQRLFNAEGGLLLATDAAAEGLNLQRRCRLLVNYELPWNPARLEQRIGRVDRIGQRRRVHAISLVARDTAEDLVVASLTRRLARVAATLGARDRLAAFLTDARTARSVVTGAPLDLADPSAVAPPLPRPQPGDYPVERVAAQLALACRGAAFDRAATVVSRLRASAALAPGYAAIVRVALVNDRGVLASRCWLLRAASADAPCPRTHAEAREMAGRLIPFFESACRVRDDVAAWMAGAVAVHDGTVRRRILREQALRDAGQAAAELQPGLFDRRALRQADDLARGADERRHEHDSHLRGLEASLAVRVEYSTPAVLVVYR